MSVDLYNKTELNALLSLGGAELRDQLSADLAHCHTDLADSITLCATDTYLGRQNARYAAHELRGIALTVGASSLATLCAQAEALSEDGDITELAAKITDILNVSAMFQDRILADSIGIT